jgi:hypothetical protein
MDALAPAVSNGLLGPNGQPMQKFLNKKDPPPKLGEAYAPWAGRDIEHFKLPGGGLVQFDLSQLRLEDYRAMTDHYQVNSSLAVLSFMQHQSDWHVECEDRKIAEAAELQLRSIWTVLNRGMSQANWAGFAPNALDWENNTTSRVVEITKVKDLMPEECEVNWKLIKGWAPPNRTRPYFKIYDGIRYYPQPGWPIPVENTFWYPLLMENGDHYGRKLLRPAFQSWFFSILLHLFANRYFERFGEPTPIGRAPFDEEIELTDGKSVRGNQYLLSVLQQLRNRSVVVLPNDRTQMSDTKFEYDYQIEYLESQMRGADFERYLTRLDEEISLAMFTPILLMRTADVGSYNLGVGHMQMYLWMLNAMNDDRAQYINKYILNKFTNYNFSPNAPRPKIVFRKMGNTDTELIRDLILALVNKDKIGVDLEELGKLSGMTLKQVRQTLQKPTQDGTSEPDSGSNNPATEANNLAEVRSVLRDILARVRPQVENAFREHSFDRKSKINLGFKKRFEAALEIEQISEAYRLTDEFYTRMDNWVRVMSSLGEREFGGPSSFMGMFETALYGEFERLQGQM